MTNDEFFEWVPFLLGFLAAGERKQPLPGGRDASALTFWLSPRFFALVDLARRHPDEFALLVASQERTAGERYGVKSWADAEPKASPPPESPGSAGTPEPRR